MQVGQSALSIMLSLLNYVSKCLWVCCIALNIANVVYVSAGWYCKICYQSDTSYKKHFILKFCALYILNFGYDTDTSVGVDVGIDKYLAWSADIFILFAQK